MLEPLLATPPHSSLRRLPGRPLPLSVLPTAGDDFALRASPGFVIAIAAVRLRSDSAVFITTVISSPTLWTQRLSALAGVCPTQRSMPMVAEGRLAGPAQ